VNNVSVNIRLEQGKLNAALRAAVEIIDEFSSGMQSDASWPFFFHEVCVTCASVQRRGDEQEREDQPRLQVLAVLQP
jgi:hypothetical protein